MKVSLPTGWWVCLFLAAGAFAGEIIQNVYNRETTTLNGKWHYLVDPYNVGFYNFHEKPYDSYANPKQSEGFFVNAKPKSKTDRIEYDFEKAELIKVPGDWNYQKEKLVYYEGSIWYYKTFDCEIAKNNRAFLYFGAANYRADVYLNAEKLGVHEGGFTPFNFEITDKLNESGNVLIVRIDNSRQENRVPAMNTDWWNFGGITRDVKIVEVPETFIADYFIQLSKGSLTEISGYIRLNGTMKSNQKIEISIPELKIKEEMKTDERGYAKIEFLLENLQLWSPDNPHLYRVEIKSSQDQVADKIGFRSITTRGKEILLNNQPVFLKGICIHEENPFRGGRACSLEDARLLLGWAKELGCNFVRLAHYPHHENMVRLADELGLLVWEENPVYWTIRFENDIAFQAAEQQLSELLTRDKNRASVIIWSMANETPSTEARMKFLKKLRDFTLAYDNTRLISAALFLSGGGKEGLVKRIDDPFAEYVDVLAFNQYIGWYEGLPDRCERVEWAIAQDKPVLVSEFGAGALQGHHGDELTRWTEEYQANVYEKNLAMLKRMPQLRGITPWILADFHSPRRVLPEIQDGWNRKGLIGETGNKKRAFFILKDFYAETEFPGMPSK
ncbi:MAG: beta-glucuronidase [Candidatus Marinimicrobia bacterium]|nr:beta-glucuronidase [Candidatus Neomarinimicrobiota bacterium]